MEKEPQNYNVGFDFKEINLVPYIEKRTAKSRYQLAIEITG